MRPGIIFVVLFIFLLTLYWLLADTLGAPATFGLQAGIVLMVIGAARWLRRARSGGGWRLFAPDDPAPSPEPTEPEPSAEDRAVPQPR